MKLKYTTKPKNFMAKIIAFIGKPGSGKDTVTKILSEKLKIPLIVVGDLLREEVEKGTELGKKIASILARGEIVQDEIVAEIVKKKIAELKDAKVILLNGYPRTPKQAELLDVDYVIELVVSDETVFERLTLRRVCPKCKRVYHLKHMPPKEDELCDVCKVKLVQREDDKEEVVKYRLRRFYDEIEPIREKYRNRNALIEIDAEKSVEEVVNAVEKTIEKIQGGDRMKMIYRVLIGLSAGIDAIFPSGAQDIVNSISVNVGREIGKELKERGANKDMSIKEIFDMLAEELKLGDEFEIEEKENEIELKIKSCNVCPKKVGGYPIRKTACPVGGIIIGILKEVKEEDYSPVPELIPGEECKIILKKEV